MDVNEFPIISLLKELDLIVSQKQELAKRELEIGQKLNSYRKQIEADNSNLIGKKATATNFHGFTTTVVCDFVKCTNNFDIIPFFKDLKGREFEAEIFEWV
jgi:hypothetical protein